jgi:VWFA-related protein
MSTVKALFSLMLCITTLAAQEAAKFTADVNLVSLFATVRDAQGHVVHTLTRDDFKLEEDGRPQTIRYFSQESELPLTLGLLIDTSISQQRVLAEERIASFRFLSQVLRPNQDRAFVIHFDRDVELLQDLTASRDKMDQALARLETPKLPPRKRGDPKVGLWSLGGTALYDSILLASDEILRREPGRKAIILLTDGVDNGSKIGAYRAIESAQLADTLVYSILFSDRNAYDGTYASQDGKKTMQRISQETGGALFEVSRQQPIAAIYSQLEEELRNQYNIGYTPDGAGSGYRKIQLTVAKPNLSVTTRDGYFAASKH